jgi:hypothetical protein
MAEPGSSVFGHEDLLVPDCSSGQAGGRIAGRQDRLWVAELQTVQIASQDNLIRLRRVQRANRIRLYQALGGGFDDTTEVAAQAMPSRQ